MEKCTTCKHVHNWDMLNQLPDALRLSIQRAAIRMDQTYCQISSGRLYEPMTGGPAA